jgi:acetyl esterase
MTLDPQCQAVLDAAARAEGGSVFDARTPEEARRKYDASTPVFAPTTPELASVVDRDVPGPDGPLPVRLYRPKTGEAPLPMLVYFHGGGWIFGNLDSHDAMCRIIAHQAGCLVMAVHYRLAPEHRFPAGLMDCLAATQWMAANAAALGGDAARLAVGGDSAGGNLAAVVSQMARDSGDPAIVFQWLIYPATDFTAETESLRANADGYLLTRAAIEWTKERYLANSGQAADPLASPGLAGDFSRLPPALVQTAEYDPLRDEGRAYAEALSAAGVAAEYICYEGMVHGFMRMGAIVDRAGVALSDGARALRAAFDQGREAGP